MDFLDTTLVGGNTVKHLLFFIGALLLTFTAAKVTQVGFRGYLTRMAERSKNALDDILLRTFERPIYWIVLILGLSMSVDTLSLPTTITTLLDNVVTVVVLMFIAWSASNLVTALRIAYVDPLVERSESRLDNQIIPIIEKTLKVAIWSFSILIAFDNIGFDIVSLLTGLGIGGLALAMAAKDTLSNVFGSVTIFADRPFQVGDVVSVKGHTGTIEYLGLRVCRLKTFAGTVVTIPNGALVGGAIENLSAREARKQSVTIGLTYDTSSEAVEAAIAALKEIIGAHELVRDDFAVRLANFGDSALELSVLYWVDPPSEFFDVVGELNLAIKRRFDAEGWDMAFPSMTVYKA